MPHYLVGTMTYHAEDFDEGPFDEFMRQRHCRTLEKRSQTFDLIETSEPLVEVLCGIAKRLAPNDRFVAVEVLSSEVPTGKEDAASWLRARGNLGAWHSVP